MPINKYTQQADWGSEKKTDAIRAHQDKERKLLF